MKSFIQFFYRFRYAFFFASFALLLWGIFRPTPPPDLFDSSDKVMHLIAFMGFGLISRFAFIHQPGIFIWLFLLLSTPLFEFLQHAFQPHRQFSEQDATANVIGVMIAWIIWTIVLKTKLIKNVE